MHWVFVAALGLSLVVVTGGYSLVTACGLLIAVASLVAGHGLYSMWASVAVCGLQDSDPIVVAHGLSCSAACRIFPD